MDKPRNKFRVVGQRRAELDIERFADAIIAFALHRVCTGNESTDLLGDGRVDRDEEPSP